MLFYYIIQMTKVLYEDKQITLYQEMIVINKYYFPLATSKTILIDEIDRLTLQNAEGVQHYWGFCMKYLNNWFPFDCERKNKKNFIQFKLKNQRIRPSITPDDPDKVFWIMWLNYTPEGKKYMSQQKQKVDQNPEATSTMLNV